MERHLLWVSPIVACLVAPLLLGIIVRIKALVAGRQGAPLTQAYRDIGKLLRKGAVYSSTTTLLFRLGPAVSLGATFLALLFVPAFGQPAPLAFAGDFLLFCGCLGLARFVTVLAAMDTGSSFEGMGASREVAFSALVEPALFLALAALSRASGDLSLSNMLGDLSEAAPNMANLVALLVAGTLLVVLLAENARIPIDDPTTHLELTMIHEVMVLDHSGPDLAAITYGASLKLWAFAALLVGTMLPFRTGMVVVDAAIWSGGMLFVVVLVGFIESMMARLPMHHVPRLLVGAGVLAAVAMLVG